MTHQLTMPDGNGPVPMATTADPLAVLREIGERPDCIRVTLSYRSGEVLAEAKFADGLASGTHGATDAEAIERLAVAVAAQDAALGRSG